MVVWTGFLKEASKALGIASVCGGVLVMVLGLICWISERRVLVRIGRFACPSCGRSFGFIAAHDAKRRYEQKCERVYADIAREPGESVMLDFDNRWEVACLHCHQTTIFDSVRGTPERTA